MTTMEEETIKAQNGGTQTPAPQGPSEGYAAMMDAKATNQDLRDSIQANGGPVDLSTIKPIQYFDEPKDDGAQTSKQQSQAKDWTRPSQVVVGNQSPLPPPKSPLAQTMREKTIVQTPNGRALYFGNAAGAADAAKAAVGYANEHQGIVGGAQSSAKDPHALKNPEDERYRQSQIAALQRQGYGNRRQNGFRNDAIVTDAFAALYGQWKGSEAGEDGKARVGLVREALREVNDRLTDAGASYRVIGMNVVGEKGGDPLFRIVTTDRDGKRHVMTRSMDEIYNTRLNAYNGLYGDASKGDEKIGAPSGNESRVISEFGDRRGVQKRYDLINREQIEKERAAQAREKYQQDQLAESRRATDEANKSKALDMLRTFATNNGGKQMTEQEYMTKVLTDPKAVTRYSTVPEFEIETDKDGKPVMGPSGSPVYKKDAGGNLVPAYEKDADGKPVVDVATGKPVQKMRTLSPDEVYQRIRDEYRSITAGSGAPANGQASANPFLEAMYKEHPEWRPQQEAAPNPAQNGGASQASDEERRARAIAALKAAQGGGAQAPAQTAPRGTISPIARPAAPSAPVSGEAPSAKRNADGTVSVTRQAPGDATNEPATDAERADAMKKLGISDTYTSYGQYGTPTTVKRTITPDEERRIQEQVALTRKNMVEAANGNPEMMAARNRRAEKERDERRRAEYDAKTDADELLSLSEEELEKSRANPGAQARGKELLDALNQNAAVGMQQREAIMRSRRDAEAKAAREAKATADADAKAAADAEKARVDGFVQDLSDNVSQGKAIARSQKSAEEDRRREARKAAEGVAKEVMDSKIATYVRKNRARIAKAYEDGDPEKVKKMILDENEGWTSADAIRAMSEVL